MHSVAAWEKLPAAERRAIIAAGFENTRTKLNETNEAVDWARYTVNPVTGCEHDCPYCYARDIAERVYEQGFTPTFHPGRLAALTHTPFPSEAQRAANPALGNIFVDSMADLFGKWVPQDWIEATLEIARRNPQWRLLMLTKFPQRAAEFTFPDNVWMGTTVDAQARVANAEKAFAKIKCRTKWLSCEPLLEPLHFTKLDLFQWVVIGGASASRNTPEWVPPMDWVVRLHYAAREAGCRAYYKTNLKISDAIRPREFPWVDPTAKPLPKDFHYLRGLGDDPGPWARAGRDPDRPGRSGKRAGAGAH